MQTFLSSLMTYLTEADIALIREDLKFKRDASLRVNILRTTDSEALKSLSSIGISPIAFPDIAHAYTITRDEEYTIKGNPIFNSGRIYLQSISSQIPALCMDLSPGMNVLDACAAPGSKTSQIMALMNGRGHLDALEPSPVRFSKLERTIYMLKVPNTDAHKMRFQDFHAQNPDKIYDRILLDVPCSGEGRLDTLDGEAVTISLHKHQAERSFELLSLAVGHLSKNGRIVFSTCTMHPIENEEVVARFLELHPEFQMVTIDHAFVAHLDRCSLKERVAAKFPKEVLEKSLRIRPSRKLEGFYVAVLERKK